MSDRPVQSLHAVTARLFEPALVDLAENLKSCRAIGEAERQSVIDGLTIALRNEVLGRTARVLLLELHAAKITGRLTASDPTGRWDEWITHASRPGYWNSLANRYPTLLVRLSAVIHNICGATAALAERFGADRAAMVGICGGEPELTGITLGAGDSHHGGQTVVVLELTHGRVIYKPRSLQIDVALSRVLRDLLADDPPRTRIRVPEVVDRGGYGWAEYVEHRYCADDGEIRSFYRGIGHWLAVTRLLSASDLHAENLIAAGPVPVVVDCETLFTPHASIPPSGYGAALDRAADLVRGSLLRSGLLPGRGVRLGLRGADLSAAGALPGEQPTVDVTTIVAAGTDEASLRLERVARPLTKNLPTPDPQVGEYWRHVVDGFDELTGRLVALDRRGRLSSILAPFDDCSVRVVLRDTAVYAELGAMLWHPAALHDEAGARRRVAGLLAGHAANTPAAPSDPAVIEAEIRDLLGGDVPYFTTDAESGLLTGPGGVVVGVAADLPKTALLRWRDLDPALDRQIIECAVISAYWDEAEQPSQQRLTPTRSTGDDLDRRRRSLAADILRVTAERAIPGADGTVTWIAPVIGAAGPMIRPLALDAYSGVPGVALVLAAYQHEVAAGRADEVLGTEELLALTLHTLRVMERQSDADRDTDRPTRPESPGGYVGIGSRIWSWLRLGQLGGVTSDEALRRATILAAQIPASAAADADHDVLTGMAGAIVPLLHLTRLTGDQRWRDEAVIIGDRLAGVARVADGQARWPGPRSADGLGGFAHGSVGIGWALARLARDTGHARFARLADAAFAFQESLYDPTREGWRDLRKPDATAANWCYGCDGLGVVAADLADGRDARWPEVLARAAAATWAAGFGSTHTICHGDFGSWEVLDLAVTAGIAPDGVTRDRLDAHIVSSLEEYGPHCAMTNSLFRPGLMSGSGGVAYQLLRMCPDSTLPTVMLPDPASGYRR